MGKPYNPLGRWWYTKRVSIKIFPYLRSKKIFSNIADLGADSAPKSIPNRTILGFPLGKISLSAPKPALCAYGAGLGAEYAPKII